MPEQFANRPESTLASGLAAGAVSLTVATGGGAKFPATGDFSVLLQDVTVSTTYELVKCTARSGDVLTITATTLAWDAGDKVVQVLDKRVMDQLVSDIAGKQALSEKGAANGYAPLGADSKVPAANLPAGGMTLIGSTLLAAAAGSIVFSAIPSTYKHLVLEVQARTDFAGLDKLLARFNGDTAANYARHQAYHQASALTSIAGNSSSFGVGYMYVGPCPGSTATAGRAGSYRIDIPNYANTTFHKHLVAQGALSTGDTTADQYITWANGLWGSTAAITSITLLPESGSNLVAGSIATLYGVA